MPVELDNRSDRHRIIRLSEALERRDMEVDGDVVDVDAWVEEAERLLDIGDE